MKTLINLTIVYASILTLLIVISPISRAALVRGTMNGFIADYAETSGEGASVFGLNGTELLGQAFTVDFYYQTELAPRTSFGEAPSDARAIYHSSDPSLDWLGLSITVNNRTHTVTGSSRRYADIIDQFSADPFNLNNPDQTDSIQLWTEENEGPFDGIRYRRQYLDVTVNIPNDTLHSTALPTSIFSNDITRVFFSSGFSINEFDVDPLTGNLTYEKYVGFDLDIQSIEASVVPVPAAVWLFGSGLIGLIGVAKRKSK